MATKTKDAAELTQGQALVEYAGISDEFKVVDGEIQAKREAFDAEILPLADKAAELKARAAALVAVIGMDPFGMVETEKPAGAKRGKRDPRRREAVIAAMTGTTLGIKALTEAANESLSKIEATDEVEAPKPVDGNYVVSVINALKDKGQVEVAGEKMSQTYTFVPKADDK